MSSPTFAGDLPAFNTAENVANLSCDLPVNTAAQALVAFVVGHFTPDTPTPTFSTPSGWTPGPTIPTDIGTSYIIFASFYRIAGISGSVTFSASRAAAVMTAQISCYNGVSQSGIISASGSVYNGEVGTGNAPSILPAHANTLLLCAWATTQGIHPVGPPSGSMTERLVVANLMTADQAWPTQTATGTRSVVFTPDGFPSGTVAAHNWGISIALAPHAGPSIPVLTSPTTGLQVTQGAQFIITWTPATSPTAAQSSLKYHIQYSDNNGVSWTDIVALTAAGVTSYTWDTSGKALGGGYKVRIRAHDPALTLYSLDYYTSGAFSIAAEAAPSKPTGLLPTTVQNKAVNITLSYQAAGAIGNPVTESTWQWSRDGFASHNSGDLVVSGSSQTKSIDFSAEAVGTAISYKVKRKGVSLYSDFSATSAFIVANLPATPNITAPVTASPPTVPNPTITFTEADAFVARRMRVVQVSNSELLHDSTASSNQLSFTSPYHFANGLQVDLFISVQNGYGLWSAEDSERVTPSYSAPAAPTITITAVNDGGYINIQITNSDTPSHNDVYRSFTIAGSTLTDADGETVVLDDADEPIRIGAEVVVDGTFQDHNAPSGREVAYYAEAVNAGSGMSTASSEEEVTQTLQTLHIHAVTKDSTTSNAINPIAVLNPTGEFTSAHTVFSLPLAGRAHPLYWFGQATKNQGRYSVIIPLTDTATYAALLALFAGQSDNILCLRDQAGVRMFGYMSQPSETVNAGAGHREITFSFSESSYTEAV